MLITSKLYCTFFISDGIVVTDSFGKGLVFIFCYWCHCCCCWYYFFVFVFQNKVASITLFLFLLNHSKTHLLILSFQKPNMYSTYSLGYRSTFVCFFLAVFIFYFLFILCVVYFVIRLSYTLKYFSVLGPLPFLCNLTCLIAFLKQSIHSSLIWLLRLSCMRYWSHCWKNMRIRQKNVEN